MSELEKRETMEIFAQMPESVQRGFAAGYACGMMAQGQDKPQQPEGTTTTDTPAQ